MPALSRTSARLLHQVKGRTHATNDDHVEQVPTPPASNNSTRSTFIVHAANTMNKDVDRSPVSSDDNENNFTAAPEHKAQAKRSTFKARRPIDNGEEETRRRASTAFRPPFQPQSSQNSTYSKRSREEDVEKSSDDEAIFGPKKHKGSGFANIHANARKKETGYGKKAQRRAEKEKGKRSTFRKREDEVKIVEPPRPKFQTRAVDDDVFEFGNEEPMSSGFKTRASLEDGVEETAALREKGSRSPSLSSLSPEPSSPIMMAESHNADFSTDDTSTVCAICNAQIPSLLAMTFRQEFTKGSPIVNYRWQQRFCRWHKQQDARRIFKERGYLDIDWDSLPLRMRRHEKHLQQVIKGEKESFHQDQLAESLGSGREKMTLAALIADGGIKKDGSRVGYYGPRGERVMTEHIISHLSSDIRKQSSRNRLVAAAGVSGGVSGFVQAVLVPELAERLVCDDLRVEATRARDIMVESAEVGELLHPDANDWVGAEDDEVMVVDE